MCSAGGLNGVVYTEHVSGGDISVHASCEDLSSFGSVPEFCCLLDGVYIRKCEIH